MKTRRFVGVSCFVRRLLRRARYFPTFVKEAMYYPYETCTSCGTAYRVCCRTSNKLWRDVAHDTTICLCPDCFVRMAEDKDVALCKQDLGLWLFLRYGYGPYNYILYI
jgi:hypothetical protein